MENKLNKQSIYRLDLTDNIMEKLKENNITIIEELCKQTKTNLKKLDLTQQEVNDIERELQLLGLNLRSKI